MQQYMYFLKLKTMLIKVPILQNVNYAKRKKISNQFRKTYSSYERQGQTNNNWITQAIEKAQQVKALASW